MNARDDSGHPHALPADRLRWRCDPSLVPGPSTASIAPDPRWLGEERPRETVRLALRIGGPAHNLILRGTPGTGAEALLDQCLDEITDPPGALLDHVFVERFDRPLRPRLLSCPAGQGREMVEALDTFAQQMNGLVGINRARARTLAREALNQLRENVPRIGRQHIPRLRAQVMEDIPLLVSDDDLDDEERTRCTDLYRGRLLRDASGAEAPPVVRLTVADARELLGSVEAPTGDEAPALSDLVAGALLQADGGYCIVPGSELVSDTAVVRGLLDTLRRGTVALRAARGSTGAVADYQPDPIPIQTRVVVVAQRSTKLGPLLTHAARRSFGLLADCPGDMHMEPEMVGRIAAWVASQCRREKLRHVRADGIARLVEEQVRDVQGKGYISARFSQLADRVREADLVARDAGHRTIRAQDVATAMASHRWRQGRSEERHRERLSRRRLRVRTAGERAGTVNGLLVYTQSGHRYGAPTRITATTAVGREGVINIEREAKLSGKTFDKGVYLLVGVLRSRFCQHDPLGMVAMITCEQSYGGIDGDSAAAAELAAILSDLAGAPVRQGLAMTGSLSQRGEMLPVGGVNEKIEGFFATCEDRGLTGGQGVIIPGANVPDLVLEERVIDAVRDGQFAIYTSDTIEETMELITGLPAGVADGRGQYPPESLLGRAQSRLHAMSRRLFPPRKSRKSKPSSKSKTSK